MHHKIRPNRNKCQYDENVIAQVMARARLPLRIESTIKLLFFLHIIYYGCFCTWEFLLLVVPFYFFICGPIVLKIGQKT